MSILAYVTTAGNALLSACLNNTLVFTRAEIGTGSLSDPTDPSDYDRTSLVTKAADATIGGVKSSNNSTVVSIEYRNASQSTDLQVKELAIYGKQLGDTSVDAEKLVCYANFGTDYDLVRKESAAQFTRIYDIVIAISDTTEIEIEYSEAYQEVIVASGILKGDGSGGVTAAVAGTDYAAAVHTHALDGATITGVLPVSKGGTNASTAAQALANLGVIYSATEPTYQEGAIWLQPVS